MDVSRQISLGEYLPANRANGNWLPSDFAGPRVHLDETVGLGRPRFTNDSNKPDGAPGGHATLGRQVRKLLVWMYYQVIYDSGH